MQIKYSIVLPCYNEFKNLRLLIPQLLKILKKKKYEIILWMITVKIIQFLN